MQLKLSESSYGDFVVWKENELIVERILPDTEFIKSVFDQATIFFLVCSTSRATGKILF